jgi:DNA polymerase V
MSSIDKMLNINSRTTGFASPAESYVDKRLDLNELIIGDVHTTFYFRYVGPEVFGIKNGNILVIDKSVDPIEGDLVVLTDKTCFKIKRYEGQSNLWGKISWILNKM